MTRSYLKNISQLSTLSLSKGTSKKRLRQAQPPDPNHFCAASSMPTSQLQVEVFTTNVTGEEEAKRLLLELNKLITASRINFDLDDTDRILRIESEEVRVEEVIRFMHSRGYQASILE